MTRELKALLARFVLAHPGCEVWSRPDFLARFQQWASDRVGDLSGDELAALVVAEPSEVAHAQDDIGVAVAKIAALRAQLISAGSPEDEIDAEIERLMRDVIED
jgi:hypothetical protein